MTDGTPIQDAPTPVAAGGLIDADIACRRCGYNLRGLVADGACPECFHPVRQSVRGNALEFSDPLWLRTLARGASLVRWGAMPPALCILLIGLWRNPPWWLLTLMACSCAFVAFGLWKLTTPDPGVPDNARQALARRILRACTLTMIVLPVGIPFASAWPTALMWSYVAMTVAVGITCIVAFFRHLRDLARRLPDAKLERETRIVMWGLVGSYILITLIAAAALAPGQLRSPFDWIFSLSCTFLIATQVFTLWCLTLIGHYRSKLWQTAEKSERLSGDKA
jgi:hypothetical protein